MRINQWITASVILLLTVLSVESRKRNGVRRRDPLSWTASAMRSDGRLNTKQDKVQSAIPIPGVISWNLFQRHNTMEERKDAKKKRKAMRQIRNGVIGSRGPVGPPGPRGPRGPHGPKGANITKDEMIEEVKDLLRGFFLENGITDDPRCTELCISNLEGNETGPVAQKPAFEFRKAFTVPKLDTAFMWELKDKVVVSRKSLVEVEKYFRPYTAGSFERGIKESTASTGRFFAPRTGFYTFFVRMHLKWKVFENEVASEDGKLYSMLLCIDTLCRDHTNLETISGVGASCQATISLNGMLYLEENQFVSVFIDNDSSYTIRILEGSQFSGYLTAV